VQPWTIAESEQSNQLRWRFWSVGQFDVFGTQFQAQLSTKAKAAAELKAKQDAEAKAAAVKAAANKKTTITCTKGKLTKKVTAVKPKCPAGYKLKRIA
jgi:hypothetical protein